MSLQKNEGSSALELSRGSLNLALQGAQKVNLNLAGKSLQVQGEGSELTLSRDSKGVSKSLGLSFVKGTSKVILLRDGGKGTTITGAEGGNLVLEDEKDQLTFKKYSLDLVSPLDSTAFLGGQKALFRWKKIEGGIQELTLQLSEEPGFQKPLTSHKISSASLQYDWNLPQKEGTYYWRVHVLTSSGVSLASSSRVLQIVQLRAMKIFNPIYTFKSPLEWDAKLVLEEMPGVWGYELQTSADPLFQQKNITRRLKAPVAQFSLRGGKTIYTRARAQYLNLAVAPPWSEIIQLKIPHVPEPPKSFRLQPVANYTEVEVGWSEVPQVVFYRVFKGSESQPLSLWKDVQTNVARVPCDGKDRGVLQFESHAAQGAYSRRSEVLTVPACPAPLELQEAFIEPAYLSRFGRNQKPQVKLKWRGEVFDRPPVLNISSTSDFKKNSNVVLNGTGDLLLNSTETLFVRAQQDLPKNLYLLRWSAPIQAKKMELGTLTVPALRMPASEELILQFKDEKSEISLAWGAVATAVVYDLQIAKTKDFKKILFRATTEKPQLQLSEKWPAGTFFWRVRAVSNYEESPWTTPWIFRVAHGE